MKAEHCHPGGASAGDAGNAVLDHDALRRLHLHLLGGEQKQIRRGFAAINLHRREI